MAKRRQARAKCVCGRYRRPRLNATPVGARVSCRCGLWVWATDAELAVWRWNRKIEGLSAQKGQR
jgi:hypothetical protein